MNEDETIAAAALILVQAHEANEDVGELIARALARAASKIGGAAELVKGRPDSQESDITLRMALDGGSPDNLDRVQPLATHFIALVKFTRDFGDTLSQVMSQAVESLGSLEAFSGESDWKNDLQNMGRQYSSHCNN